MCVCVCVCVCVCERERERERGREREDLFEKREREGERRYGAECVSYGHALPVILLTERIIVFLYFYINNLLVQMHPQSKTEHQPSTTS